MSDGKGNRTRIALAAVLVCVVFAVAWFYLALSSAFACSGDGGSPYAADDSMRGRLCDARDDGGLYPLWAMGLLLAPALVITGAIVGLRRRAWRIFAAFAVGGFVVLALVTIPFLALPSECSPEQEASGGDCEHY